MIYPPRNVHSYTPGNSTIDKEKEKKVPGMIG